jgi:hypothetical protein
MDEKRQMSGNKWNVGDEVIVQNDGPAEHLKIDRVARKYFYVREGRWNELAFEITTGRQKVERPNYPQHYNARAYTPEEYEDVLRRRSISERWNGHRLNIGWGGPLRSKLSMEAMEQIVDILDAELERIS